MYQEERLIAILDYLKENNRISVEQICTFLDVSRDTARRDLVKLEEEKLIIRTRGGAISLSLHEEVKDYSKRLNIDSKEKKMIGKMAASFVHPGDKIILDASTTVQACAEHIQDIDCTIITNSINSADILSANHKMEIQLLGGTLEKKHRFLYGSAVVEKLSNYHVDKAFIGVVGISENGIMIAHEEDGYVKRKMLQQSNQVIVLADHTKIGVNNYFRYAEIHEIDVLITDRTPEKRFCEMLKKHNVELLIANNDENGEK